MPALRRHPQRLQRRFDAPRVAAGAPGFQAPDLLRLDLRRRFQDQVVARGERRGVGRGEHVDADDNLLAALDRLEAPGVGFDELALHVALLDRRNRAAHFLDRLKFRARLGL